MLAFEEESGVRAALPEVRCRELPGETDPQTDPFCVMPHGCPCEKARRTQRAGAVAATQPLRGGVTWGFESQNIFSAVQRNQYSTKDSAST